jgi:MoxR-like ATPase
VVFEQPSQTFRKDGWFVSIDAAPLIQRLRDSISSALLGKPDAVRLSIVALLAEGHILIEDAPGVGKTVLAKALSRSLDCEFRRIQFTPDLLPSDILGSSVFLPQQGVFEFRPGPLFTNILFADEINRTTPRTQSALLEAMSEGQASVDGKTHTLNTPFFVVATQNPHEFEGTYPLPENQLDRFMICLDIGYPDRATERSVLTSHRSGEPVNAVKPVVSRNELLALQQRVRDVRVEDSLNDYLLDIVDATRKHDELALGVSPRGALTLYRAVQGLALFSGRDYAIPDDIKALAGPVLAHRVVPKGMLRDGLRVRNRAILQQLLGRIPVPR